MNRDTGYRLQFRGTLQIDERDLCPIVATVEFDRHDPTSLEVQLRLIGTDNENQAASTYLRNFPYDDLSLKNEEDRTQSVQVLGINGYEIGGVSAIYVPDFVQIGISTDPLASDMSFHVKAELTPSGILVQPKINELFYTGDTRVSPIVQGKIEVSTGVGNLEVGQRYAHFNSEQHGNAITHSVERLSITSDISIPSAGDLSSTNELLVLEVQAICTVLSLCYRQPVQHYEIEYLCTLPTRRDPLKRIARRRLPAVNRTIKHDELINYRNLINGGLQTLLRAFQNSERAEEISRVIDFLASSYKLVTLESSYFLAYSALDLVSAIDDPTSLYLLSSAKWKKLEKALRQNLNMIAEEQQLIYILDELKGKLPELRRTSGDKRIVKACAALNVNTSDLWPNEGFEAGLKTATGMRNDLFHSALAENRHELFRHLVRVRTLVERMLLKILDWPDDQIWVWYDQNLRFVNQRM